jgi:2-polyprenyl-3-methyl-5-hydroxy-6-metoxy-1,4-benzoquinol methylase
LQFSSFRDPSGKVYFDADSVWRVVDADGARQLSEFLELDVVVRWSSANRLIATELAKNGDRESFSNRFGPIEKDASLYTHPRVDFPSFPYEWAPEMLQAAGEITLDLAEGLLQKNWGLKDATPYNILFEGADPVFVDVLSFERRDVTNPIWLPYSQFVKTFLLPLLVNKRLGIPLKSIFLTDRDGLDVSEASNYFGLTDSLTPQVFSLVTVPNMLVKRAERKRDLYSRPRKVSAEQSRFVLKHTFKRLRRQLAKVAPDPSRRSKWTGYTEHNIGTIPAYMKAKQEFVEGAVTMLGPESVLDVGCNTGYFSFFAARAGARVVALDHDPAVVGQVWRYARREHLNVLPLVVDLSRPSPRMGWRYSELPSFLDRAEGKFDLVMMLAVLHHIIVQERIPLRDVLKLASDLTTDALIIEFVPPSDPLFRHLARGRDYLYAELTAEIFRTAAHEFFTIVESRQLPETERSIYLMRKR